MELYQTREEVQHSTESALHQLGHKMNVVQEFSLNIITTESL